MGNERVLRARLDDAKFFFNNDRKKSLEEHRADLVRINYQEGMGNMLDKSDRLMKLSGALAEDWGFTDEEKAVFRRGKNAKSPSPAKNQSSHDYHIATGFEALMGYLYLSGQMERLEELIRICLSDADNL